MWNAFGNGLGLHGVGGGCVSKAQGWEFVPCSKSEKGKGRGTNHSPFKSVSSVDQYLEQPLPGLRDLQEATDQVQFTRHELQTQHSRLKKKFQDLKKRHEQDKEGWMREKELLLKQVADIQGGENRRILLDLKSVLEGVQLEIKDEETKRTELQLQYTKDRCSWELERAELQHRIAQLEARESSVGAESGTQDIQRWWDREEQRRLLSDTHTAAMALRCHLERTEQGWARHKTEMLERFDAERREWEVQLRDMQRKVEQLYDKVKIQHEKTEAGVISRTDNGVPRHSLLYSAAESNSLTDLHSVNSNSSSDPADQHSSTPSECPDGNSYRQGPSNGYQSNGYIDPGHPESNSKWDLHAVELEEILQDCLHYNFEQTSPTEHQTCNSPSTKTHSALHNPSAKTHYSGLHSPSAKTHSNLHNPFAKTHYSGLQSPSAITHSDLHSPSPTMHQAINSCYAADSHAVIRPLCIPQTFEVPCENDRRKNMSSLNAAWKEIAKVSEELCSYQDEMRRKTERRRESFCSTQCEDDDNTKKLAQNGDTRVTDGSWCDFQVLEEQNWMSLEGASPDIKSSTHVKKTEAPPVPLRTTSWYLLNSTGPWLENPKSHTDNRQKSGVLSDWKSSSPSVLRKFGAVLQDNGRKTLTDSGLFTDIVPANSKCNIGCCHSRWSSDVSKFGSSKSSTYVPVQSSISEPKREVVSGSTENYVSKCSREHKQLKDADFINISLRSSPLPASSSKPKSAWKNETLEKKTAEFNRVVFQTEAGYEFQEDCLPPEHVPHHPGNDSSSSATKCSSHHPGNQYSSSVTKGSPHHPDNQSSNSVSKCSSHHPSNQYSNSVSKGSPHHPGNKSSSSMCECTLDIKSNNLNLCNPTDWLHHRQESSSLNQLKLNTGTQTKAQQAKESESGSHSCLVREAANIWSRVLNEQTWLPGSLATCPRPVDSRSNYGAIEKILQSYHSSDEVEHCQPLSSCSGKEAELFELLGMLEMEHLSSSSEKPCDTMVQRTVAPADTTSIRQENERPSLFMKKSFSRPARPANQRPPSRWASNLPALASGCKISTSVCPQRRTVSNSCYTETIIF